MRKFLLLCLVFSFVFSSQLSSNAATKTLKAAKAVSVSYPDTVTLKKTGCQNIPFKYSVGSMPAISFSYIAIIDDADAQLAGDTFYKTPKSSTDGKIWKKNSSFNLKVCRSDWSRDIGDGEYEEMVGANKGTYQLYLVVYPATEVYATITFK